MKRGLCAIIIVLSFWGNLQAQFKIETIAGNGFKGFSGDGNIANEASLNRPLALYVDENEVIYFVDAGNHRIRKIEKNGIITTIAGNGKINYETWSCDFIGDGGAAKDACLSFPTDIIGDKEGNLYIVDLGNYRIRKIDRNGIISTIFGGGIKDAKKAKNILATDADFRWGTRFNIIGAGVVDSTTIGGMGRISISNTENLYVYAGPSFGFPDAYIWEIKKNGALTIIDVSLSPGGDLVLDALGNIYIVTSNNRIGNASFAVIENTWRETNDPSNERFSTVDVKYNEYLSNQLKAPTALLIDENDFFILMDMNRIVGFNLSEKWEIIIDDIFGFQNSMDIFKQNNRIYVADTDNNVIRMIKLQPSPDFNGDGKVDFNDFIIFAANFGRTFGSDDFDSKLDLDDDGLIGFSDFLIFMQNFGKIIEK